MPQRVDTTYRWLFHVNTWPEIGTTRLVAERVNEAGAVVGRIEYGVVRTTPFGTDKWGLVKYAGGTKLPFAGNNHGRDADGFGKALESCTKQIDAALGYSAWDEQALTGVPPVREGVPPRPIDGRTRCENCDNPWGQHNGYRCLSPHDGEWSPYVPPQSTAAAAVEPESIWIEAPQWREITWPTSSTSTGRR